MAAASACIQEWRHSKYKITYFQVPHKNSHMNLALRKHLFSSNAKGLLNRCGKELPILV